MTRTDPALLRAATEYVTALALDGPHDGAWIDQPRGFEALKEASSIHGVGPLLGLRVEAGEIAPPDPLASWLVEQVSRNRTRLTRMRAELLETLAALAERGFVAMPLKGGALLLESVERVVWRTFADLDLLVLDTADRRQDLDLALAHAGYCLGGVSWKHRSYSACAPGPPLVIGDGEHPDNPRDVEVHAAVVEMFRGFRWDLTPLLLREPGERAGRQVPSDAALALHLAIHASVSILEGTAKAINLIDLARAIELVGPMPLYLAARDAGLATHARFLYPAAALTARETHNPNCLALSDMLRPWVTAQMAGWAEAVSLYHISWAGRDDRSALDRYGLWARSRAERARMLATTLLPAPSVLASENLGGTGPISVAKGYGRHYRRLASRIIR
ncbi:MAG TPA: nucleotidyltransferase family protein [Thermomicrobiales bacterium]|nr:nucleotidyltransferase family protein [Thermomicrobiales bacterium]